jgi:peptidoglycan/LPS O-acetylase OafA/YrhL
MERPRDQHIAVLDGLRGMAIIGVLSTHALEQVWPDASEPFRAAAFFRNGWSGVDLFFVLSGFLITGQLLDARLQHGRGRVQAIGSYLKRRFCRIAPAYYVTMTFTTLVFAAMGDAHHRGASQWAWSYVYHLLFLQDFLYARYWPIYWSLAIEAQFYLLAPFFLLLLFQIRESRWRLVTVFSVAFLLSCARTVAVLHWHSGSVTLASYEDWFFKIRILLPFSLDGILGGMLCRLLWNDEGIRRNLMKRGIANALFFGGLVLLLALTALRPLDAVVNLFDQTFMLFFLATAFSCMMLGLLAGSAGQAFFSSWPLRYIATVSYSMYLLHLIVIKYIFDRAHLLALDIGGEGGAFIAGFAVFTLVTVFLSTLMYELVERPFIKWAKKGAGSKEGG